MLPVSVVRAPIGEILVRHEHLRPRELERLLTEQRKHRLVSMLILRAEIEIDDATLALSEQSGYPAALERHLEQRDGSLARTFPQTLMRNFGVVPMTKTAGGALVVVARDPSPALADVLAAELGMSIELAIAPAIFLERLIQRLAGGVPSALPPELPPIDRSPPSSHRKSVSSIMSIINTPVEPAAIIVEPSMPVVELPTELIQPCRAAVGITLELDEEDAPALRRPNRPTRPIPGIELQPLLVQPPSLDDLIGDAPEDPKTVSTRPTRPSVAVPNVPDERPRASPNIIKRPPTPLPVAPQPIERKITEVPEVEVEPDLALALARPTYPKLMPPPPSSVFDADTARPPKRPPTTPPPIPRPPTAPPATPRARTLTDNWDDFEDSKVGMAMPPPEILDQMSTIGITPPPVEVPPAEPPPIGPVTPTPCASAGPQHPRAGSPPVIPPIPPLGKLPPPAANITKDIEKAMSRATADRLLMKHAATRWNSLLLVTIAADRAKGARGHGSRLQAGVEAIDVAIASSILLQAVVDPAAALPDGKDPLFELLGGPAHPSSAAVVVGDQVVAVLAAGDAIDGGNPDELASLAGALAVAYQRFPK